MADLLAMREKEMMSLAPVSNAPNMRDNKNLIHVVQMFVKIVKFCYHQENVNYVMIIKLSQKIRNNVYLSHVLLEAICKKMELVQIAQNTSQKVMIKKLVNFPCVQLDNLLNLMVHAISVLIMRYLQDNIKMNVKCHHVLLDILLIQMAPANFAKITINFH